jgi:hypothetical protein
MPSQSPAAQSRIVGRWRQALEVLEAAPDLGQIAPLPHRDADLGPQDVAHDEAGFGREGRVDGGNRVAAIRLQLAKGRLEHGGALVADGRDRQPARVGDGVRQHMTLPGP